ncbi:hypothetical protein GCM10027427_05560 [Pseudoclavibacter terrae]
MRPGREREAEPEQHGTDDEHHAVTVIELHVTAHDGNQDTVRHALQNRGTMDADGPTGAPGGKEHTT